MLSLFLLFGLLSVTVNASNAFYGLNYGVNRDACPTLDSVKKDFRTLSQYTNLIRVYSIKDCNLGQMALQAAQETRMRLYLGMWVDKTDSFDQEYNALEHLVASNSLYNVEGIIVGSEVMYRGDIPANQLSEHIQKVKQLVGSKGVQVTTSEVYYKFDPQVIGAVDFVMMNAFIYWEGENIDNAVDKLKEHYLHVKQISNGKQVKISETGWPDVGPDFGSAVPLPENQKNFMLKTLCMTRRESIDMIWFSAMDEAYKPGVEGHFGLLDNNRQLKGIYRYESLMSPCSP